MGFVQQWRKTGTSRLLPCIEQDVRDRHPSAPNVLRVGDHLRMYYHGRQGERIRIGFAEASADNPQSWKKHPGNPVLDLGPEAAIDSHWVSHPQVPPATHTRWRLYHAAFASRYRDKAKTFKVPRSWSHNTSHSHALPSRASFRCLSLYSEVTTEQAGKVAPGAAPSPFSIDTRPALCYVCWVWMTQPQRSRA